MKSLMLSSYLAPISYYAALYGSESVCIERCDHYAKQTYRNRTTILSESGPMDLIIPVVKTETKQMMRDVKIADRGNWQQLHYRAIESAYGKSPFFEYYQDDLRPLYEKQQTYLFDFNQELMSIVLDWIEIDRPICYTDKYEVEPRDTADLREAFHPKRESIIMPPYYQVFDAKHGFKSDLSIIDLVFNLGPETAIYLRDLNRKTVEK